VAKADSPLGDSLVGLAYAAAQGAAQAPVGEDDSLALRARAWFVEAYHHPIWVKYRREAQEDVGFYVGGEGQWSKDGSTADLERIKGQNRAAVSINHIQAIVDVLTGFERQNRFDPKVLPQGEEDEEDARLMTWLLKFQREQTDAASRESLTFEDGVIGGMGAMNVRIDWTEDPLNGMIDLQRLEPGVNVMWDGEWERDDLSDARYVLLWKQVFVKDLIAQHPKHAEAIRGALNAAESGFAEGGKLTEGDPRDGYGSVHERAQDAELGRLFYDETEDRVLVLEAWYRDYESVWIISNKPAGTVHEAESESSAREVAKSDPDNLTVIERQRRVIKMGVTLPAAYLTLEEDDTPYDNDAQHYPVVPFIAKRKGDEVYGLVRNLKDPQRVENKRESQVIDILTRLANMRPILEENTLVNPTTLNTMQDTSPITVRPGKTPPGWFVPPLGDLFRVLTIESDRMKVFMRESSGINTELLGVKDDATSGIAIARRQAQGQVIATVFFDNYRAFKRRVNERLARRIQQVFTAEQTFRLTNEIGESIAVKINPVEGRGKTRDEFARIQAGQEKTDRQRVLRNLQDFLKYDVIISDAPSTPSMRMMQLLGLLEVLRTMPALGPLVMDKVVELLDIPDKPEIMARVRAALGAAAGGGQAPLPSGPGSSGGGQLEMQGAVPTAPQPFQPSAVAR